MHDTLTLLPRNGILTLLTRKNLIIPFYMHGKLTLFHRGPPSTWEWALVNIQPLVVPHLIRLENGPGPSPALGCPSLDSTLI